MALNVLALNCTLKPSSKEAKEPSSTHKLLSEFLRALGEYDAHGEIVRVADLDIKPGVTADEGDGDEWPALRKKVLASDILVIGSPIWLGQPSSVAKRVLERMDAFLDERDAMQRMPTYGKVGLAVVVGNEDGAHHVISEIVGGLIDIGFTVPGQAWTYWNMGPGPGPSYTETDHKHDWSAKTGRAMASNLVAAAKALAAAPIPKPPD